MRPEDRERLLAGLLMLGIAVPPETLHGWLEESALNDVLDDICLPVAFSEQAVEIKHLLKSVGIVRARLHKFRQSHD
jgi:hypothetical protein